VGEIVDDVQSELNTVFNLDRFLGDEGDSEERGDPVTITVEESDAEDED
jgi:hypothetical protein